MKNKIFVDGRVFDTEYQGTRTYIQNLYNVIDKIGDLEIFIASENPENAERFFPDSKNINFISYKYQSKPKRLFFDIPQLINKYKIDIAHFQYIIAPLKSKTLQIVTIHDILFKDFPEEFSLAYKAVKGITFSLSAKKAKIVTTVSEYSKNAINKHFKIPLNDIHVVPNGVGDFYFEDYDKAPAQKIAKGKFGLQDYLLYVSRVEPRKNHVNLLKSYLNLELYRQNKQLVFVGKQSIPYIELNGILNGLAKEIKDKIIFLDNISDQDLRTIYQAANLFIYPSKAEGFGIPPLEAAALQIQTICSNNTAMADFTFFGQNHIDSDVSSITKAIQNNLQDQNRAENLKEISNIVKGKYSWTESAQKLNNLVIENLK